MPTYEYECTSCKHTFDLFQSMRDEPVKDCPLCKKQVRRLINGGTGIIFKGSGFYVNDKSGSSSGSVSNGKPAEAKPADSKPAESAKTENGAASCQSCPMSKSSSSGEAACSRAAGS